MDDDFEEIVRGARALAPCTVRCIHMGRSKLTNGPGLVSITFRAAGLDEEVNEVLRAAALSAAYSPSQRAIRIKANAQGQFHLSKAPRAEDVFLLRFPRPQNLPWFDDRYEVSVDVNPGQCAIFLDLAPVFEAAKAKGGATVLLPQTSRPAALAAPASQPAETQPNLVPKRLLSYDEEGRIAVLPSDLGGYTLTSEEGEFLWILSNGSKYEKTVILSTLQARGVHITGSANTIKGRVEKKLIGFGVEVTESTDKRQMWLAPMARDALRRLVQLTPNS